MNDIFITDEQHKELVKRLTLCLNTNKKSMIAMKQNNIKKLLQLEKIVGFNFTDRSLMPIMINIAEALTRTRINGEGQRSTALTQSYDNLWTIGTFGSVFIDLKIKGKSIRVHLTDDQLGKFDSVFLIENIEENIL